VHVSIWELAWALAVGLVLGLWFFGGLLWTVRRVPAAQRPVLLMLISFVLRTAGVAAGLVWLMGRHWGLPVAALVGFLAIRFWMVRTWGNPRLKRAGEQSLRL